MSDLTDYAETEIRDWLSQGVDPDTAPTTVYVGLHTSDPGDAPDGTTEVGAADYDRVGVSAGTGWNTPNTNDFENANEISFGTATNDWGTITHVSLWDSATTGNAFAAFALSSSKAIAVDDEATFPAGNLSFALD